VNAVDVIRTKRDGGTLSDPQIDWVVDAYTRGVVADEQMSALAMAILLRGMTPGEISRWTAAMIASGERLDLSTVDRPTVDKHSTGGVGDKITLPLTPLVAACGGAVPQLSGRGLGHTGGTLDKLESIPGFRTRLSNAEFIAQLGGVGAAICAAGEGLAPADRKLYALRDVTGTVEAIPLIASSIMSKKIAEGTASLVLDVKVGLGAFMKDVDQARELARTMVDLGHAHDVNTVALLTRMDTPLGHAVGNAIEVTESVEVLAGGGPADVVELTLALAHEMLTVAGLPDADPEAALKDGRAMDSWRGSGRAPADGRRDRVRQVHSGRICVHCGRVPDRGGGLAARCRTGAQGGPGVRRGRGTAAQEAGRCRGGRRGAVRTPYRRSQQDGRGARGGRRRGGDHRRRAGARPDRAGADSLTR